MSKSFNLMHFGDAGDCVVSMPIMRALGKASMLVQDNPYCKPITTPGRFDVIQPIIESQPYVERFAKWDGSEPITHDVATFRDGGIRWGSNLCTLQAEWVGMTVDQSPWLKIDPNHDYDGAIVVNRSTRHQNQYFPWRELMDHYHKDVVFVGLPEEHRQLSNEVGRELKYVHTRNLLESAAIIEASRLFIGNQSSNVNLAFGLGKRAVCEASFHSCDCLYDRDVNYVFDGEMAEYEVEGYKPFNSPSRLRDQELSLEISPPGQYWILKSDDGTKHRSLNAKGVIRMANEHEKGYDLRQSTLRDLTVQMLDRFPGMGNDGHTNIIHSMINNAKQILGKMGNKYV